MLAKSKKVELNEEFIAMWKEEQRASGISCPLCIETKMKRQKFENNVNEISDLF